MEYPMAPFLTLILLTFATDHVSEITLSVQELISNVTLRAHQANLVEFNDSAVFTCSVSNGSSLSYLWTNGSDELAPAGGRVQFSSGDAVLTITNVTRYDLGPFRCRASNNFSNGTSDRAPLNISYGPSDPTMVTSRTAYVTGSNVNLSCMAESKPTATLQWFFNDRDLGFSDPDFQLQHANVNQTGYYKCLFHNTVTGRFSSNQTMIRILDPISSVAVSLVGAPAILDGPETPVIAGPPSALIGQQVTFNCSASSQPPSQYSWYHDGSLVARAWQYEAGPLTTDMSGRYICMAFNNVTGRNTSANITLTVYAPVTMAMVNTSGVLPKLSQNFSLTCDTLGSVESVLWMKNGSVIQATDRIMLSSAILTFSPVLLSDNGYYECQAYNPVSNLTSGRYALHVACDGLLSPSNFHLKFNGWSVMGNASMGNPSGLELGPLIVNRSGVCTCEAYNSVTHQSSSAEKMLKVVDHITHVQIKDPKTSAIEGLWFALRCNATGTVDHVYWMKNGEMFFPGNSSNLSVYNTTLTFNPVSEEDVGNYQCTAANAVNNMTSPTYGLQVSFGPHTPVLTGSLVAETGEDVVFNCSAVSYPLNHYNWYLNESLLATGSVFATGPLTLNMSGEYTCEAVNQVTKKNSTASASLRVVEAIKYVAIKQDSLPIQSHNFTLSCEVAGPYHSIYWTKDGFRIYSYNASANHSSHAMKNHSYTSEDMKNHSYTSEDMKNHSYTSEDMKNHSYMSYHMINDSLHFSPVTTDYEGIYRCVAENVVRPHSSPAYQLLGSTVSVLFTCSADSRPASQYQWYINMVPVVVGAGPQLTISTRQPNVLNYTCKAYNNVTQISMSQMKTLIINEAGRPSVSPGVLLVMALSALGLGMYI
ncbi:hypothetical protein NHX12_000960 [Muraenolepis orangiensis]|uniref:Ig-like domain-containing protein n=1 Tax=Muraenolepis orangiensis TaxID=630683 RepID=A0A9Q0DYU2_9TELE|nr:hypothetical protein NHX12_000960 [Muraenolepis orangiensis]